MTPEPPTVAALYVETGGVYYGLPGVDPWDERRDARRYRGPWPVVAHPPCGRWSRLAPLVQHVHGYAGGDGGGCFEHALWAVRTFGGVLEHPANTLAWAHFGLPKPAANEGWTVTIDGEAVCYVQQEAFGHVARKPTWLYAAGVDLAALPWHNRASRVGDVRHWVGANQGERPRGERRLRGARASRTPPGFRDALLAIARTASDAAPAGGLTWSTSPQ